MDVHANDLTYAIDGEATVQVTKLAFFEASTPDLPRLRDYYEQSLGLSVVAADSQRAFLTTGPDHHCVVLSTGPADGRARLGFEIAGPLEEAAERLRAAGVPAELRTDPEPGIGTELRISEHGTGTPISLIERQAPSHEASRLSGRPSKLGHVASYVEDLAGSQRFYLQTLGFRWSDIIGDFFTFLRCGPDHHAVNLMQSRELSGLFHVAFEMRDLLHLKDQLDHLATRGHALLWGPGRHGAGHNVFTYHADPDGNVVELFTEIDQIFDEGTGHFEPRPWHETWPQGPRIWEPGPASANTWGIVNPDFLKR